MKRCIATLVLLGVGLTALPMLAQDGGEKPASKILQIIIEDVKPGRGAAHETVEAGWPRAFRASNVKVSYIAASTITGGNEAWFVAGYPSLEAWEQERTAGRGDKVLTAEVERLSAADGEHLNGLKTVVARYREEMSHRPALNLGKYRYVSVITVRVRPGQVDKFVDARKLIKAAHEKANMTDYYSVYEVMSGLRGPAFMIFIPMKTLAEADAAPGLHTSDAYKQALGGELGDKRLSELVTASVVDNESTILAFSATMSLPTAEMTAADPEFWTPKPMVAAVKTKASGKKQ